MINLAYLVLAHNTPNHLSNLLDALNSPNVQFFIHIDRKSDELLFEEKIHHQNVTFIRDRVSIYWGEFSIVQATINLIREALKSEIKFDYLILISGSDYPLKNAVYINDYFTQRVGTEFINLVEMPNPKANKLLDRLYRYKPQTLYNNSFYRTGIKIFSVITNKVLRWKRDYNKVLKHLKPYAGSQWWALSADACQYILCFVESNPKIVKFFKNTWIPDELFFQTIIGNSKFKTNVARNLTFAEWKSIEHPEFLNLEHLERFEKMDKIMEDNIYGKGELLFARKFRDDSSELTDFIDKWIEES